MKSTIDQLCAGNLHPLYTVEEHRSLLQQLDPHLSPEVMASVKKQLSFDTYTMFHAGFCLGMRLMSEVMAFEDI